MYPQPSANPQDPIIPDNISAGAHIQELQRQIAAQAYRIAELETRLPQTNLISPNFLTRAFAVWGHYFVSNLILGIIFGCIGMAIGAILFTVLGLSLSDLQMNW
ncbi:MAG TPA: hypothetical protein VLM80_07775 [Anaerolineales bacterium]|nr:hypothetical protein [Anaerolineales bacterium]